MKVYELLDDRNKWTQRAYARDKDGHLKHELDPDAVCWCLAGAIYKCYKEEDVSDPARLLLAQNIRTKTDLELVKIHNYTNGIECFNDECDTTYEKIIELCKQLDI